MLDEHLQPAEPGSGIESSPANEMIHTKLTASSFTHEYGVNMFRFLDLAGRRGDSDVGVALVDIPPDGAVTLHAHDEHEIYFILSGNGQMTVGETCAPAEQDDCFYIQPRTQHSLKNSSNLQSLKFIAYWWLR